MLLKYFVRPIICNFVQTVTRNVRCTCREVSMPPSYSGIMDSTRLHHPAQSSSFTQHPSLLWSQPRISPSFSVSLSAGIPRSCVLPAVGPCERVLRPGLPQQIQGSHWLLPGPEGEALSLYLPLNGDMLLRFLLKAQIASKQVNVIV